MAFRISVSQRRLHLSDREGVLRVIARDAKQEGSSLLLLPELSATGYCMDIRAANRLAEPFDGPFFRIVSKIASEQRLGIAWGYVEKANGKLFNSAALVDESGALLLHYRKTHLWGPGERSLFEPGPGGTPVDARLDRLALQTTENPFPVCTFRGVQTGLLICYDIEFPEPARLLALKGAKLILVPTASFGKGIPDILVPARAMENHCIVAYCNRFGVEKTMVEREGALVWDSKETKFGGRSVAVGPDGKFLGRASDDHEDEFTVEVDLKKAAYRSLEVENPYLTDRRRGLYSQL